MYTGLVAFAFSNTTLYPCKLTYHSQPLKFGEMDESVQGETLAYGLQSIKVNLLITHITFPEPLFHANLGVL